MIRSGEGDEHFRARWRKLGFFCDFAEEPGRWRFVGSRGGLLKFRNLLDEYVDDLRNAEPLGEHDHHWPYMHLKIETWHEPEIVGEGPRISGTLDDLRRLARLVEEKVDASSAGDQFIIDEEYSEKNKVALVFEVREEGFDPASMDPYLESNE